MKKILLIIILITAIFQMVVIATAIDIGGAASDRGNISGNLYTFIANDNPANGSGKINSVEIWCGIEMHGTEVAIFTQISPTHFATRDYETVNNGNGAGVVLGGSKQTFVVDLDVEEGDYIGIHNTEGNIDTDTEGGQGKWYIVGDKIPCTDNIFTMQYAETQIMSLYGTGATAAPPAEGNAIMLGINF